MPDNKIIKPNKKQQECIDNISGKYLVLAGPGTGKTFTVIQRIKSMIEKGISPEKILCLTFTDAAANEMKTRIDKELNKISSGVNIYTYHGFCYEIIENNAEDFELPDNFKIISEAVSRAFVKECIDELQPKAYRTDKNDPYFYIDTIKRQIDEIKKYRLSKNDYFKNLETNQDWYPQLSKFKIQLEEKIKKGDTRTKTLIKNIEDLELKIEKAKELWDFYELYSTKTSKNHYLDFNDMICLVLKKFENNPAFLDKIANNYEYILVDEYQDTNKSQNSIVFNLTKALKSENVFVVGDDDQIIYSFQGAKLDTIEKFLTEFPDTKVICLDENMRSTQSILNVAREITKQDSKRLEVNPDFAQYNINKELTAKNENLFDKNVSVRCYNYVDIFQEYQEIVKEIDLLVNSDKCPQFKKNDKQQGKKLSEIAILTRSNAELETFAELLKDRNIPYELKEGKSIFTIKSSTVLYYYMQMLTNPELYSDKIFKLLLAPPFNINAKDYMLLYEKRSNNKFFIDSMREISSDLFLEPEKIQSFIYVFDYLCKYKANESLKNVVLEIGSKTGIFDYYLNSGINRTENIAGIKKLIDEAIGFSDVNKTIALEEFVEYLNIALEDDIEIKTDKAPVPLNAIQLSTYYSAKGREFEYVYMPTLLSDKWESDNKSLKPIIPVSIEDYKSEQELKDEKLSDRIRVMYVGMTRAKHTLRLSYVQKSNGKVKKPSSLIVNIQDKLDKEKESFEYDETSFWHEVNQSIIKRDYDYERDFCYLVDSMLEGKAFSPSSINTYLKCPRQYMYNYVLGLGAKSGNADNMHYGTAVHTACQFAIDYAVKNLQYPTKEEFVTKFFEKLKSLPLSGISARQILEGRGKIALDKYYQQLCLTPISELYETEKKLTLEIDNIKFVGYIDRLDKNEDGTYTIYDYKTGNSKSSRVICPDGEHEDYYNQIGLYKLYFEKITGKTVRETVFIFPEDFTNNLTLNLTEQECIEIENKFKQAIADIRAYKFQPTQDKNKKACQYCQYKDFCMMEIV